MKINWYPLYDAYNVRKDIKRTPSIIYDYEWVGGTHSQHVFALYFIISRAKTLLVEGGGGGGAVNKHFSFIV